MSLTIEAIKIRQRDVDIYVTTLRAGVLIKNCAIAWWKRDDQEGYQRPLKEARLREIKHYLLKEVGVFPTSILANVRGEIRTKSIKTDSGEYCEITIPDHSLPLYIIDGQHRVEGLRVAIEEDKKFEDYPLIVSLFQLPEKYDEMLQFHIVNSRAKSVPTDLAQRHIFEMTRRIGLPQVIIGEGERSAYAAYAVPIVDELCENPESPWYERVQLPDEPRKKPNQVIKQRPLADSIYFILKAKPSLMKDIGKLANLLKDYWNALKEIFPTAFAKPKAYTLQATPGTYSLHMVFPEVYAKCEELGDTSKKGMESVLRDMFGEASKILGAEINDDFWSKEMGVGNYLAQATSMKLIKALAQYFREALWKR